ncbi:MAG: fumarylacetoacetase [Verrucomicrobia bacterium]|jgi:fumarylacetoacetase|nr:MAG: fumarylacetoacetase [Verrucomicrobiota bacterium]
MSSTLNFTHDAARRSWVEAANDPAGDFPLQNLPTGIFCTATHSLPRPGVAIGDQVLDLAEAGSAGMLPTEVIEACRQPTLNALMALGPAAWSALRGRLSELLGADTCPDGPLRAMIADCLVPLREATLLLPARVGDYTDFYASIHHATNVGAMLRPDSPLLPNYQWVPVGYHGRASSLIVSGTPVRRPQGQSNPAGSPAPVFGPSQQLDYELELAAFVGPGNSLGTPIPLARAEENIFGVSLLNDWSARDLQSWEYQPLGPFLAKNFATTVSPWVVSLEALVPFRTAAYARPAGDPAPLPYLAADDNQARGGIDLTLEVLLLTPQMRARDVPAHLVSRGNFSAMYWTLAQLLTHHASNGCNLLPGDLLGSGTVSGPEKDARGCLLELTTRGREPLALPGGEARAFLQDGDEVIFRGYAARPGFVRVGLGECRGTILPAST